MSDNNENIELETTFNKMPLLGDDAPEFTAMSSQGEIKFPHDYKGKWVVLFSHPADFTPVCTSEIATFAALKQDFDDLNTALVGLSVDSNSSHLAWIKTIQDKIRYLAYNGQPISFPIVADLKMDVAKKYGMIQPSMSDTKAVRAVFIIDPHGKIRTILYYPLSTGRNMDEIKRILRALQLTDKYNINTPANWKEGDAVLVSAPADMEELRKRIEKTPDDYSCQDWFFCSKPNPSKD